MTTTNPREIPFNGVRIRFDSKKSFDELVSALLADVGEKPLMIDELPAKFESWESYKAEVESHVGPSGFILFALMNHGAWIKKLQIQKKVLRVVIGNPLLAITMLRHDLTAGLFAPVELILIEEDDDQSSLTYVRPSSLMVVETNEPLLAAARGLDEKLQALAAKVTATKATGPLAVLEAAFKIIPGKETPFLAYQASVVPLAAAQPGFRAGYSGPVWGTTWVYFGARFDSEEQMNAWHGEPQHRVIQKSAPNWWTSLYLRKWRRPMPGEVLGDRLMSETNILVDAALDDTQKQSVRQALAELSAAGAQPFETLTGEFEVHPFQFSGPLLVAPPTDKVPYLLTTHWSSADHFNAWKSSCSYRALQSLGDVSSELFVPLVETRPREHLRYDKLQRDWEWPIEDRPQPLPVLPWVRVFPAYRWSDWPATYHGATAMQYLSANFQRVTSMKPNRSNQRTNLATGTWRLIMNSLKFCKTYPSIILAVLVLILSGQRASTYGQTPEPTATPRITPGDFVDALNSAFGKQTTNRATHAKGIVLLGKFTPTSQAAGLSKATHFKQAVPIAVRFSDNTGIPTMADAAPQARPLGMSIKFHLPDGTDTDLVTHSLNGFPAKTPEDMRQFILAIIASGPGVAAPTPIQKYLEAHPEAKPFATAPGPPPVSYGTIAYFGVNTFKFIAADGKATFGRYQIIPEAGKQFVPKNDAVNGSHDYLIDEIRTRVGKEPVRFKLVLQLPTPGDKLDDPSIPWSDTNKTIEIGLIEITSVVPDSDATQRALLFLPSLLPDGIEPADPMIRFRGLAYPVSYDRRHP